MEFMTEIHKTVNVNRKNMTKRSIKHMKDQNKTPLLDAVTAFRDTNPAYFRIPGHRLEKGVSSRWTQKVGTEIFAYDVTETPYTDDLHQPEGAIREAEELLQELYHADRSYFLVNGSTCGNEAMIIASVMEGEEIMIARNAHKSAMMGLIISGATPVYVGPQILSDWGLQGGIRPEDVQKCFEEHPKCKALFMVSPSYYGISSDLEAISSICHAHGAVLLVDEAHGGHLYFHEKLPQGALEQGADMCVQSMHKVTGALTQSSVLHIHSQLVDADRVSSALHIVQSTSPNYLLMTSLDCARFEFAMHGHEMMQQALELAAFARKEIRKIEGFDCMGCEVAGQDGIAGIDGTRLVITAKALGLTGFALEELLFQEYAVNMELADYENTLAVVTYANTGKDMSRLIEACHSISKTILENDTNVIIRQWKKTQNPELPPLPEQVMTPRQAYFAKTKQILWQDAVGRISAEMVAPYPPGIPILYAGERITQEVWDYLEQFRRDGRHIHGAENGRIGVIAE